MTASAPQDFLPFVRPNIDDATIAEVGKVLASGWITSGPKVQAFEATLSDLFGGRPVRTFSNGSATMEIALRIADIGPGDEVITTPITWVATANVVLTVGARPVFVDMVPRLLATSALLGLENNTKMFIGCLSPTDDDPGQWERYGDGGTGCAIGTDARFLVDWAGVNVRRVVYDRDGLDRFVGAGLMMLQEEHELEPDDREALLELAQFFVSDLYAFKRPQHRSEREIRISRLLIRDAGVASGFSDHGGNCPEGHVDALVWMTNTLGAKHPMTLAIRASLKLCFEEQLDWTLDDIPRKVFEALDEIPRPPGHKVFWK